MSSDSPAAPALRTRFCSVWCYPCRHEFRVPRLDAHAYGEFILCGRGTYRYLNSFHESVWDDIAARLKGHDESAAVIVGARVRRFHVVVAAVADPADGHRLTPYPTCPQCGSTAILHGAQGWKDGEVPAATFSQYTSLPDAGRDRLLSKLWAESLAGPQDIPEVEIATRAFQAVFAVFKMFEFQVGVDIRLGSLWHLFEEYAATPPEVERAIEFMKEKSWLIVNQQPGARPGGYCLTLDGLSAVNNTPNLRILVEAFRKPLPK